MAVNITCTFSLLQIKQSKTQSQTSSNNQGQIKQQIQAHLNYKILM